MFMTRNIRNILNSSCKMVPNQGTKGKTMEEKIKVNLTYLTYYVLTSDMERFGFYRGNEVNKSRFLSTLIVNYFPHIEVASKRLEEKVRSFTLKKMARYGKLTTALLPLLESRPPRLFKAKFDCSLSFRPSKECLRIIDRIESEYLSDRSMSDYLRSLFDSYVSLPQAEREAWMFRDTLLILEEALSSKTAVKISSKEGKALFRLYAVLPSREEYFVYAVGLLADRVTSIRLNRLGEVYPSLVRCDFDEEEEERLARALAQGPDYLSDVPRRVKVRLSKEGKRMLRAFWHNRPEVTPLGEGVYLLEGPYLKLFNYLLRFGKEMEILEPASFKKDLAAFYLEAAEALSRPSADLPEVALLPASGDGEVGKP